MWLKIAAAVILPISLSFPLLVHADESHHLTFEFVVDAQMSGSRPWDGTGISSAAIDAEGVSVFGTQIPGLGTVGQVAVDQLNERIGAPDPFICIIASNRSPGREGTFFCSDRSRIKADRSTVRFDVGNALYADIFGIVLLDADEFGISGGPLASELIGYGIYVGPDVFQSVQAGDVETINYLERFETLVTEQVDRHFGISRAAIFANRATVDLSKVSLARCESGCRFGDSNLTIRKSHGGW